MNHASAARNVTRRDVLKTMGTGAVITGLGGSIACRTPAAAESSGKGGAGPYNILFILTDQERYFRPGELPAAYRLPAHERLKSRGIVFENHRINSCVCTPSRSVLYTGQHIQQTRMFDNTNFPWIGSLSTEIRTIRHMLRDAGYYTAYKGKWHLTKEFETVNELGAPQKFFTKEMEAYGFSDYFGVGDIIGHTQGGYLHDGVITAMAVNWLRGRGTELAASGKPWFLAVNLVNPHDVMYLNNDRPGQDVPNRNILGHIAPEPAHPLYATHWEFDLPASHTEALDAPGRPRAHAEFLKSHDALLGNIANEEWRWRKRHDYYLNCLRHVDSSITSVLDELEALGLDSRRRSEEHTAEL